MILTEVSNLNSADKSALSVLIKIVTKDYSIVGFETFANNILT